MSRASLLAALIAVEVAIVGVALYSMGIGQAPAIFGGHNISFGGMERFDFTAKPIADINAGSTPRVSIDDPQSGVTVKVSSDGLVHVKDMTSVHGARWPGENAIPQLTATRTADGVAISRASHVRFFLFGSSYEHIEVDVPAGSQLAIGHSEGAEVDGLTGGVTVRSQDGRITLNDLKGTVDAHSDDGSIHANGLALSGNNTLTTDDGRIELGLAPGADLAVAASTDDGSMTVDGTRIRSNDDGDAVQHTIRLGNGTGSLRVATRDGSVHITTNGAQ